MKGKRRVLNAVPVNSTMLPVRFVVHCVQIRHTLVAKEEKAVASIVQLDGRPTTAVQNVSRAVRGRSALVAKNVHWALPGKGTTMILPNADLVN